MNYTPNRWVVLEVNNGSEVINKVFAGWAGGYLDGDSWKLNSGNAAEQEFHDRWEFTGYSGSVYVCYKNMYGMSAYMTSVFSSWNRDIEQLDGSATIKILDKYT